MKKFYLHIRDVIVAGIIFLIPLYVVYKMAAAVWGKLYKVGAYTAEIINLQYLFGPYAIPFANTILISIVFYIFGWLVRLRYFVLFRNFLENTLLQFVPGYLTIKSQILYKVAPEEDPRKSVLVKTLMGYRYGLLMEKNNETATIFFPDTPDTNNGEVLLEKLEDITMLEIKPKELLEKLQAFGVGLNKL